MLHWAALPHSLTSHLTLRRSCSGWHTHSPVRWRRKIGGRLASGSGEPRRKLYCVNVRSQVQGKRSLRKSMLNPTHGDHLRALQEPQAIHHKGKQLVGELVCAVGWAFSCSRRLRKRGTQSMWMSYS